jgi:hypothetical protein
MAISRYRCNECMCWWIGDKDRAIKHECSECGCRDNISDVLEVSLNDIAEILITKLDDILDAVRG